MAQIDYAKIELLVLDVDGVLTDGRIVLTSSGQEIKFFNAHDGAGMKYWKRAGGKLALITGRDSDAVRTRARELDVDEVRLDAKWKLPVFQEVLAKLRISPERTAVIGDDLPDLPLILHCAFGVAVADAAEEVRDRAKYVTRAVGGAGAVREVIELILKNAGKWDAIMSRYLSADDNVRA